MPGWRGDDGSDRVERGDRAVMMWPSTMKSSIVSASKSGGGRKSSVACTVGRPSIWMTQPSCSITQSGSSVAPFFHADVELDDGAVADPALPARGDAGDAPRRDRPRRHHEVLGRLRELGLAHDLVELDAERVGDHRHRLTEHGGAVAGHVVEARGGRSAGRTRPAARCRASRRRWCRPSRWTVTLSTRLQMPATVMASSSTNPGLMPVPNSDEPPRSHASTRRSRSGAEPAPVDERGGRDDVDAGLEDADQLVDRRPHRVVDDAVGLRARAARRRRSSRRRRSDRCPTSSPTSTPTLLVGPGVATDQLEDRVGERSPCTDSLPTFPVVHCTTRMVIATRPRFRRRTYGAG